MVDHFDLFNVLVSVTIKFIVLATQQRSQFEFI